MKRAVIVAGLGLTLLAGTPAPASAATITVDTTADVFGTPGDCSLREAVISSRDDSPFGGCVTGSGTDTIDVPAGLYRLTRTGIEPGYDAAVNDLDLQDPSDGEGVSIRGIGPGAVVIDANGIDRAFDSIDIDGITISGVTIQNGETSSIQGGGAIRNDTSRLIIRDSTIRANVSDWFGGGISGVNNGAIVLENVTVSGNRAADSGGGIHIHSLGHFLTVRSSTVTNNVAETDGMGVGGGGGISEEDGTVTLQNSIVAGNADGAPAPLAPDCRGSIGSDGNNLIGTTAGCSFGAMGGDLTNIAARLGPLANNGGSSFTHALLRHSPAIDRGSGCEPTDQRGLPRSLGGSCDIGAYELARCGAQLINRVGTPGPDTITGTNGADGVAALGGNDRVFTGPGRDWVCAGAGHDRVFTRAGIDRAFGGPGADRIYGGGARDFLFGNNGFDRLYGGSGGDRAFGGGRLDRLFGGPGFDRLFGGPGNDRAFGGAGRDYLNGANGRDRLFGGTGSDRLVGLGGRPDRCYGGNGPDRGGRGCEIRRSIP